MDSKARFLFTAAMDVDADKEALFNEVYDTEHIPELLKVPGCLAVYRTTLAPLKMSIGGELKTIVADEAMARMRDYVAQPFEQRRAWVAAQGVPPKPGDAIGA